MKLQTIRLTDPSSSVDASTRSEVRRYFQVTGAHHVLHARGSAISHLQSKERRTRCTAQPASQRAAPRCPGTRGSVPSSAAHMDGGARARSQCSTPAKLNARRK
uniref:Uncharacterized protein n=1 Tax=Arundo donax TaxID=35708 RepID=A0A0A9FID2_ARUDO